MAFSRRICVDGRLPETAVQIPGSSSPRKLVFEEDFIRIVLSDMDWLERFINGELRTSNKVTDFSRNFVDYLQGRQMGNQHLLRLKATSEYGTRHLLTNNLMREEEIPLERLNKVFCSQWLNDRQVVFGTKCNKLVVLDVRSKRQVLIPNLNSSDASVPPENPCGIHALQVNPSRSFLATGATNANDVAVYKLPTLDPVAVGEGAHKDWIFDIAWLDDEFFVSGSRDTNIALWRVQDSLGKQKSPGCFGSPFPHCTKIQPLSVKKCKNAEKVRALLFNERSQELVALSLNAYLHLWDAQTFKQKFSRKLPFCQENVCITQQVDHKLYAVGSRSHITLLDNRTLQPAQKVASKHQACGIRSLSFLGELLTIGTGVGVLLFYDLRAGGYLEQQRYPSCPAALKVTRGWVYPDETQDDFLTLEYSPAIYTHSYDQSGTRLFTAGGPLPASLQGNYAGLWR